MISISMDGRRSLLWSLSYVLLLLHCIRVACQSESYTYTESESYVEYPQWLTTQEGLAVFSFRASQANGLLFYLDSDNNGGHYLVVWLQDGRLKARMEAGGDGPLETTFGEHLNDLSFHKVLIKHFYQMFEFYLDDQPLRLGNITYDINLVFETQSSVFLGGLPSSYTADYEAAMSMHSLAGCVENVRFADNSIIGLDLEAKLPLRKHGLLEGCVDNCTSDVSRCNGGECVTSWSNPDGYFCDCSAATSVGENCASDSSNHQLTLSGDTYYCYTVTHQPFTDHHDDITVQLQSPLPSSGTILTGHSANWTNQFSLYWKDSAVHYELRIGSTEYVTKSTATLSPNQNYRVSVTRSQTAGAQITIKIQSVSSTSQIAAIDTTLLQLSNEDEVEPVFPFICVGGGDLEMPTYSGTLERLYIGHIALLEQRNSTYFTRKQVQTIDLINLLDEPADPALTFRKHGLQSDRVSFQFRLEREHGAGILLIAGNDTYRLTISIIGAPSGDIIMLAGLLYLPCVDIFVLDNRWHLFQLEKFEDPQSRRRGVMVTIDYNTTTACRFDGEELNENFDILTAETSVFQLGPTTGSYIDPDGRGIPFLGCFQNIEFVTGSETFRPNLEVPIAQQKRFSSEGCLSCTEEAPQTTFCLNGGQCQDTGAFDSGSCICPPEFTGQHCDELVITGSISPPTSPSLPFPDSTSTPPPSETTPTTSDETTKPTTSSDETSDSSDDVDYDALGQWVGIATAIVLILILLVILLVFIGCFLHSQRIKRVGFYRTQENRASVALPHFSASLKTAHSHTLNLEQNRVTAITNGHTVHPTYVSGEKEFYI